MNLDSEILLWIQECLRNPVLTQIVTIITRLGDKGMIWILISGVLMLFPKTRKIGAASLAALLGSYLINNLWLKNLIARGRPFDCIPGLIPLIHKPEDFSFPSGHTGSSFAAAWVFYRNLPRRYGIPALILACLIGFSRLYLGVHYPSDVLAGMLIGIGIAYLTEKLLLGKRGPLNGRKWRKDEYHSNTKYGKGKRYF